MLKLHALLATDQVGSTHAAQGALLFAQAWQGRKGLPIAVATSQLSSVRSHCLPRTQRSFKLLQAESPFTSA